jgi:hypothetical protein
MTDPVDTEALRAMAAAGDYNMGPFAVAAADEVDRLREQLAAAEDNALTHAQDAGRFETEVDRLRAAWEEAEVARSAATAYGERLRAVIENAPHDARCTVRWGKRFGYFCTCWKAEVI